PSGSTSRRRRRTRRTRHPSTGRSTSGSSARRRSTASSRLCTGPPCARRATTATASSDKVDRIRVERLVLAHDRDLLGDCLGDQETVEGIPVVERERHDQRCVREADAEERDVVLRQLRGEEAAVVAGERELAEADLDRDLPEAGDAEQEVVRRLFPSRRGHGRSAKDLPRGTTGTRGYRGGASLRVLGEVVE